VSRGVFLGAVVVFLCCGAAGSFIVSTPRFAAAELFSWFFGAVAACLASFGCVVAVLASGCCCCWAM